MSKGGGAWKVAYADFVTAMMAFFMVMWLVAQSKPVKESIAAYFNDPSGHGARPGKSGQPFAKKDGSPAVVVKGQTKGATGHENNSKPQEDSEPSKGGTRKQSLLGMHDGNQLTVETLIPFDEESAELDDRGKKTLDSVAAELAGKLSKIEIRGHASVRPLSKDSPFHNPWELCYARSMAAMKYLVEQGIEPKRMRLSQGGSNEPEKLAAEGELLKHNARVEIFVLNESTSEPAVKKERPKKSLLKASAHLHPSVESANTE